LHSSSRSKSNPVGFLL